MAVLNLSTDRIKVIKIGKITVDSQLSATSENPVQNKAITAALNNIPEITVDSQLSTTSENPVQNKVITVRMLLAESNIENIETALNGKVDIAEGYSDEIDDYYRTNKLYEIIGYHDEGTGTVIEVFPHWYLFVLSKQLAPIWEATQIRFDTTGIISYRKHQSNTWTDWNSLNIDIDNALSATSENPVQNKVITANINTINDNVATKERVSNKVQTVSAQSTHDQYPDAVCLYTIKTEQAGDIASAHERISTVESIAKGANVATAYSNYDDFCEDIIDMDVDFKQKFNVGQNFMIKKLSVPDLWLYGKLENPVTTAPTEQSILNALTNAGYFDCGYGRFAQLETQKVNLTNYLEKPNITNADSGISTVMFLNNHEWRITGAMQNLEVLIPDDTENLYESYLSFTTGSTITFTDNTTIIWTGDDCNALNEFIPQPNTRYEIAVKKVNSSEVVARVGAY